MGMRQQLRWGMLPQAGRNGGTARRLSASEASVEQGKKEGGGMLQLLRGLEMVLPLRRVPVDEDAVRLLPRAATCPRHQGGIHRVPTAGHLQRVSPFHRYLFSQIRQELDITKRPLHQKWWGWGSSFQCCKVTNTSVAGISPVS